MVFQDARVGQETAAVMAYLAGQAAEVKKVTRERTVILAELAKTDDLVYLDAKDYLVYLYVCTSAF